MSKLPFEQVGREIAKLEYTNTSNIRLGEFAIIQSNSKADEASQCLLSAIIHLLDALPDKIGREVVKAQHTEAREEHRRAMELEKQKQKTAAAELKVIEAMPPKVTMIQATNRQITRASDNGHVLRRF